MTVVSGFSANQNAVAGLQVPYLQRSRVLQIFLSGRNAQNLCVAGQHSGNSAPESEVTISASERMLLIVPTSRTIEFPPGAGVGVSAAVMAVIAKAISAVALIFCLPTTARRGSRITLTVTPLTCFFLCLYELLLRRHKG